MKVDKIGNNKIRYNKNSEKIKKYYIQLFP